MSAPPKGSPFRGWQGGGEEPPGRGSVQDAAHMVWWYWRPEGVWQALNSPGPVPAPLLGSGQKEPRKLDLWPQLST